MSPLVGCPVPGGFLSGGAFVQGSFARGDFFPGIFCPGALLAGGIFVRGAFARRTCPGGLCPFPQVQCVYALSLSVPTIVAWRTNKKTNEHTNKQRQTRPRNSAGSRHPLPKFSWYVEVEAHYIFHPSTIWVRPLFTELGPKKTPKSQFCHEANEYMSP